jgi:hypothetical protein
MSFRIGTHRAGAEADADPAIATQAHQAHGNHRCRHRSAGLPRPRWRVRDVEPFLVLAYDRAPPHQPLSVAFVTGLLGGAFQGRLTGGAPDDTVDEFEKDRLSCQSGSIVWTVAEARREQALDHNERRDARPPLMLRGSILGLRARVARTAQRYVIRVAKG